MLQLCLYCLRVQYLIWLSLQDASLTDAQSDAFVRRVASVVVRECKEGRGDKQALCNLLYCLVRRGMYPPTVFEEAMPIELDILKRATGREGALYYSIENL